VPSLLQTYGFFGGLRLLRDLVMTKLTMPQAQIVRRPVYVRGRRWIQIGPGLITGPGLRLDAFPADPNGGPVLRIGRDVQVNDYVHIGAVHSVSIGDRVLIASKVFITDHNHGSTKGPAPHDSPEVAPIKRPLQFAEVVIEDDVWIGEFVSVLPGVRIGKGAIVGTMSVVSRDVPAYTMVAGSPARAIKQWNFETKTWERI
jgi:acetyltransferase-like isoleucine patch superfamily enzyme